MEDENKKPIIEANNEAGQPKKLNTSEIVVISLMAVLLLVAAFVVPAFLIKTDAREQTQTAEEDTAYDYYDEEDEPEIADDGRLEEEESYDEDFKEPSDVCRHVEGASHSEVGLCKKNEKIVVGSLTVVMNGVEKKDSERTYYKYDVMMLINNKTIDGRGEFTNLYSECYMECSIEATRLKWGYYLVRSPRAALVDGNELPVEEFMVIDQNGNVFDRGSKYYSKCEDSNNCYVSVIVYANEKGYTVAIGDADNILSTNGGREEYKFTYNENNKLMEPRR